MSDTTAVNALDERASRYKEKLIEALALTLPISLITALCTSLKEQLLTQPWRILWIAIPLIAAAWFTWRIMRRSAAIKPDRRWFIFLGIYCSIFALASSSELLVWKRLPQGYYQQSTEAGREWLIPVWLGDWRYRIVRRMLASPADIAVLLLDEPKGETKEQLRWRDRNLIELAQHGHAKGIAFDVAFEGPSAVDSLFCTSADAARFRILSTYDLSNSVNAALPKKPPTIAAVACLPVAAQGHAMGFAEADGRVRSIPLYWEGDRGAPAFSVRIAEQLQATRSKDALSLPRDPSLLRFIPPAQNIPVIKLQDIANNPELLENYFLIVGEQSSADSFKTPFGLLPGAVVHAYAAHSLLSGHYITRPPAFYSAFIVFASCYVLTLFAIQGASVLRLLFYAGMVTVVIVALSAAAIYFWNIWLDVIYAVAATWLLLPLLVAMRWKFVPRSGAREEIGDDGART